MPVTRGEVRELVIGENAPGGAGVSVVDHDGERRAIFVRGAASGDRVRASVDWSTRPARARLLAVVSPSPDRVSPACPYTATCGGCDWMHLSEDAQRRAHVEHVRAVLPAAWRDADIAFHAAPAALQYRTRTRLHVTARRGKVEVGFHQPGSHHPAVVDACAVLHPAIERGRRALASLFAGAEGRGEARVALGQIDAVAATRAPVLDLTWDGALPAAFFGALERAVNEGAWQGASVRAGDTTKPAVVGDPTPWIRAADGAPLQLASGSFAQASEAGNALLAAHVAAASAAAIAGKADANVVELHAGSGNFSVLLARLTSRLTTVESDADACRAGATNLEARGLRARVSHADATAFRVPRGVDLVVLDPPRAGAKLEARAIVEARARHVVYVSCDPSTLGRDLAVFAAAGYRPRSVAAFDMFPQTSHVESVVSLARERIGEDPVGT